MNTRAVPIFSWTSFASLLLLALPVLATETFAQSVVVNGAEDLALGAHLSQPAPSATLSAGGSPSETVGPWTVGLPYSASVNRHGGPNFGWLNTSNAYLSYHAAFCDSIAEGGYANPDSGTTVVAQFWPEGVLNGPGWDLVLFDARFDQVGSYEVTTEFDGHVATYSPTFVNSGEVRNYYYELITGGPFPTEIWGAEIDLSDLGIPEGSNVRNIYFTSTDGACDFLGIGRALHAQPLLQIDKLNAGSRSFVRVTHATPGGKVYLGYSTKGTGPTFYSLPCGTIGLSLGNDWVLNPVMMKHADASGDVTWYPMVPAGLAGLWLTFQALDFSACRLTNYTEKFVN